MKRFSFLTAGAAAALTGCGGSVQRSIAGLPPTANSAARSTSGSAVGAHATPTEPIPSWVLLAPIIGEEWRFDGTVAPPGWIFADGTVLKIKDHPALFSVLGTIAGGDGRTTFALPHPALPAIIAVRGFAPTSPQSLASLPRGQHIRHTLAAAGIVIANRPGGPKLAARVLPPYQPVAVNPTAESLTALAQLAEAQRTADEQRRGAPLFVPPTAYRGSPAASPMASVTPLRLSKPHTGAPYATYPDE